MLDKRLNDKGKNWRHVFKALTLLDYILHAGSENCVMYFRCASPSCWVPSWELNGFRSENVYIIKTLKEFQFIDEYGKDQGANGAFPASIWKQRSLKLSSLQCDKKQRTSRTSFWTRTA